MVGFDGMIGRAAAAAGVAAALVAGSAARPSTAQDAAARKAGDAKVIEKVAPPVPVGQAVVVEEVTVKAVAGKRAEVKAAVVAPAGVVVLGAPDADAMAQARLAQLRPILRDELRVLTLAAAPTPEQRRAVALAGGRKLKEVAKTPENNRPRINLFGKRIVPNDPAKLIHDAVEVAAREALAPEQFARFQAEARARAEDRREASLMVVAMLDRTLHLGRDQRDRILDGLRAAYDEATFPTPVLLARYGDNYFPVLPAGDDAIAAHLGPEQKLIWSSAQKLDFRSIMAVDFEDGGAAGQGDPDLEAALAVEPKP